MQVIQRRGDYGDNREDFYRDWNDYKHGFGSPIGEFWLGNDQIHELTKSGDMRLRVELEAHDGRTAWAEYDTFRKVSRICFFKKYCIQISKICRVEAEDQGYRLHIGGYSGTAGDSMVVSGWGMLNGMKFTTKDRDNDESTSSCAQQYRGAWWFSK